MTSSNSWSSPLGIGTPCLIHAGGCRTDKTEANADDQPRSERLRHQPGHPVTGGGIIAPTFPVGAGERETYRMADYKHGHPGAEVPGPRAPGYAADLADREQPALSIASVTVALDLRRGIADLPGN